RFNLQVRVRKSSVAPRMFGEIWRWVETDHPATDLVEVARTACDPGNRPAYDRGTPSFRCCGPASPTRARLRSGPAGETRALLRPCRAVADQQRYGVKGALVEP